MDSSASAAPRGRVLVVDDDRVFGLWASKVLEPRGYEVHHVLDPVSGLARVEGESWDLVITDIEMPRMNGLEFLKRARRLVPGLPVAVITAHPTVDRAVTTSLQEDTDFIQKPVSPDLFAAKVEDMISRRRPAPAAVKEAVLAVGAHPGDVEIGVAGVLLAHQAAGVPVTILTLCAGVPAIAESADGLAGASRLSLDDLEDGDGSDGPAAAAVGSAIRRVWPTVIYTHSVHDSEQDHRDAHLAVLTAARRVDLIYGFQSPSATLDFRPGLVVPIEDQLDGKLRAVAVFSGQAEVKACLDADLITSTARYWARLCAGRDAEALEVVRDRSGAGAGARGVSLSG
jgi:CheY-like chemotaxis protein/LmbE family N-acetylglucosaminyl deacetylase